MEYHIANNFENQIEKTLENIIEIRTSNELSLTPTDVLNLPTIQNIRDETIRKRHTDAKKKNSDFSTDKTIHYYRTISNHFSRIKTSKNKETTYFT